MAITLSPPALSRPSLSRHPSLTLHPSLSHAPPHHRPVTFLRHPTLRHHHRRLLSVASAILQDTVIGQDTCIWTEAPIARVLPAAESLFHVIIDLSNSPDHVYNFVNAGQYVKIRIPEAIVNPPPRPAYFYIASPPSLVKKNLEFEFLIRSVPGTTSEVLCRLKEGDVVDLTQIIGRGFDIEQILPPEDYPTVLIFVTGYGMSAGRSFIEEGFGANKRSDVRLYYGCENLERMGYQERIKIWEASGVRVTQVLSRPPPNWNGAVGYVQDAYLRDRPIVDPRTTGAVLIGNDNMIKETRAILEAQGVSPEKILVTQG